MEITIRWRTLLIVAALVIALGLIGVSQGYAKGGSNDKSGEEAGQLQQLQQPTTKTPADAAATEASTASLEEEPDEPPAEVSYAVVRYDGTLARELGAVASSRIGKGQYVVAFDHDVSECAYVATIGIVGNQGIPAPGEITVAGRYNNPNAVFVATFNSSGALTDRGFHLQVACPPAPETPPTPIA